ncbi:MAG: MBL fold metallo-hydrolase [Candidatus Paceibacterota bacterium]
MIITFYGENCFKIQSGETTILTDTFTNQSGLTPPRFKPDILIKTLTSFPLTNQLINYETTQLIYGPGEYNLKNTDITGFGLIKESTEKLLKTVYLIKIEDIKLGFLGHLSEVLEPEILEYFEEMDLLFIPSGGSPFIDQKSAVKLIKQLEPKIVIPSFFKVSGLKRHADDVKNFIEEFNHQKVTPQEKLTIKKKDLGEIKKTKIVCLKI